MKYLIHCKVQVIERQAIRFKKIKLNNIFEPGSF